MVKAGNPLWKKGGESPNPGGRPSQLRSYTDRCISISHLGLDVIEHIIRDEAASYKDKLTAIIEVNKRAWGNPPQSVTLNEEKPIEAYLMTQEQLRQEIIVSETQKTALLEKLGKKEESK